MLSMKMNKIFPLFLCLAGSICALSGCKDDTPTPDPTPVVEPDPEPTPDPTPDPEPEPEPEPIDPLFGFVKEVKIKSLYDGFVALYQTKNYTMTKLHTILHI